MNKLFGTDGIRGKAGSYPLDDKTIFWIGDALAMLLKEQSVLPKIIIGRDTRESGPQIEEMLSAGIRNSGGVVHSAGIIPTPGIAFLSKIYEFNAGIIVSASHNPYQDNGIKIFNKEGYKLSEKIEEEIENKVFEKIKKDTIPSSDKKTEKENGEYLIRYKDFLISLTSASQPFAGYKIVLDCANGAVCKIAPDVFRELGAEVDAIFTSPDGKNINRECGALYPLKMSSRVVEYSADLGIAFDGDGDRAIFSDHKGNILDGDYTLMICARNMNSSNKLPSKKVVATVMSNIGLEYSLSEEKLDLIRAPVGDKWVLERMIQEGANLGGEQSGHIIFADILPAGDGIITAIEIMNIMRNTGKFLADLAQGLTKFPQVLLNVTVKEKVPFGELFTVTKAVKEVENALNGSGRLLLRYSGTEPLARIMIEGEEQKKIEKYALEIAQVIRKEIGD